MFAEATVYFLLMTPMSFNPPKLANFEAIIGEFPTALACNAHKKSIVTDMQAQVDKQNHEALEKSFRCVSKDGIW